MIPKHRRKFKSGSNKTLLMYLLKIIKSQLPEIVEGFIKAQIKGFDVRYSLMIVLHFYFTLGLEKFK